MNQIKILIFGNYNSFILSLISRLDREGHTVFVVTGQEKKNKLKPRGVFQQYNFSYSSENIEFIIENVEADIAIFEGAIDRLGELEHKPSKISSYISDITNITLCLKGSSIKQLIYVSSLAVFSGNTETIIDENTIPNPRKNIEKTILMGERVCRSYDRERDFKVSVIRLSEVYGSYNDQYLKDNICTNICEKVVRNNKIEVCNKKEHNLLYIDDAVDGIYKALEHEGEKYEIYHVAGDEEHSITEEGIANILKQSIDDNIKIEVICNSEIIPNKRYIVDKMNSLNFSKKYQLQSRIEELYETIKQSMKKQSLLKVDKISIFAKVFEIDGEIKNRVFPFLENLLFMILLNIFVYFTINMAFHEALDVYLLYAVIISLIYGYSQSIFAIIMSVISKIYIIFTLGVSTLSLPGYYMYIWILEIFTIGILVGYLKEQYKIKYRDMKDENEYLGVQLASIKDINKSNEEIKDLYERRLLNYKDSFGRIYEIVSELDTIEPQGVIFKSIRTIGKVMNTNEVSIYIQSKNSGFFRLMASSCEKPETLRNSIKVSDYSAMFSKIFNGETYVNSNLDPKYPMMANGTYKGGELEAIIMIWSLPFEYNNLYQMNVFGIVCKLIERSLNIGYEYIESISKGFNKKADNVIDRESFEKIVELYKEGAEDNIASYYLLQVKRDIYMNKDDFNEILKKCVRETDYIGESDEYKMNILLANTSKQESIYVIDRLKNNQVEVIDGEVVEL